MSLTVDSPAPPSPDGRPSLPPARLVSVDGRGSLLVREDGPRRRAQAPAVFLLHGWTVSADLNWWPSYGPVAEHYRMVSFDHRGHGHHGLRDAGRFHFAAVADDVVSVADALDIETFVAVGYSMGGAVAQQLWRRHRERVSGIVLAATASRFGASVRARTEFAALRALAKVSRRVPSMTGRVFDELTARRLPSRGLSAWEQAEIRAGDPVALLQAGSAIGRFDSTSWLPEVDVPHGVIVTTQDQIVDPRWQRALVDALPSPTVVELATNHYTCTYEPDVFPPALVAVLDEVTAGPPVERTPPAREPVTGA